LSGIDRRLDAVNFFLADVRGGLGPFVSVYLVTAAGWTAAETGVVLTISGLIGITLHTPVGALIDAVRDKRLILIAGVGLLSASAISIQQAPFIPVVFLADVVMAVLGGVFAPTMAALTLGLAPESAFLARLARNTVWDRLGNLFSAAVVGLVGWVWPQRSIFYVVPLFGLISVGTMLTIPPRAIDHERARGFEPGQTLKHPQSFWSLLTGNSPLLILALTIATFNFANNAMLPLVGQKLGLSHPGLETALTSACILVAQITTIPTAILLGTRARALGLRRLLALACVALAVRGLIFASFESPSVLVAAQVLDGAATGIRDILLPQILSDFVTGSGRYSTSRGLLGTVEGLGGSLGNAAGGAMVVAAGYDAAFALLAFFAAVAFILSTRLPAPHAVKMARLAP
jgi:MFS family permease